jgi:hypothetical protein
MQAPTFDPGKTVTNRPISTFDKNQLKAPLKHILFKCNCDYQITDDFNNLQQALHSQQWTNYQAQHMHCAQVNLLPAQVQHQFTVSCTECPYHHRIKSHKQVARINDEILHSFDTTQKALLRQDKPTQACSFNCNACLMQNYSAFVADNSGCHYKYMPFQCTAKFVIYVIHCQHCNQIYIGQTRGPLKARLNAHLSNIRKYKNTSIARHFNSPDHNVARDFKIGIIDVIAPSISGLNIREATWIHHLDTIADGINEKDEARISLDYQTLAVAHHFRHSSTCLPKIISKIIDISTLSLQHYKRLPWVRTRYPINDQSNTAMLPDVPCVPQGRGTLFPVFVNSTAQQQRSDQRQHL